MKKIHLLRPVQINLYGSDAEFYSEISVNDEEAEVTSEKNKNGDPIIRV
jgi:hypothetical protein